MNCFAVVSVVSAVLANTAGIKIEAPGVLPVLKIDLFTFHIVVVLISCCKIIFWGFAETPQGAKSSFWGLRKLRKR
jgi:hypothetical protein